MQQTFTEQILCSALCCMLKYNSEQDRFNPPKLVGKQTKGVKEQINKIKPSTTTKKNYKIIQ